MSVNPIIFANFALPFGEKSERSGKALAFFRGSPKSPIIEITHRKKDLRSSVLSFAPCDEAVLRHSHIDGQRGHLFLSFRMGKGVWRCRDYHWKVDEVLSFLVPIFYC